jgi:hypothetical protein
MGHATLTEALALLRHDWPDEVQHILEGQYSAWIGSGVSRYRFPDLHTLLRTLLIRLHAKVDPGSPNCPYRRALEQVVQLTTARGVNYSDPPVQWPQLGDIVDQLRSKYSQAMGIPLQIGGHAVDLFWDVLQLQIVYSSPAVEPDADHRFLALLIEEGIFTDLVTTNWDSLIEVAHQRCCTIVGRSLKVVVRCEEIDGSRDGPCRLLMIHGSALRAAQNPDRYRPYLVVTQHHVTSWASDNLRSPLREAIRNILRERPALFIGLSGQDYDLQAACIAASLRSEPFPVAPARVIFTQAGITAPSQLILEAIYGEEPYREHSGEINERAALPLYAKPLLGSLWLMALLKKAAIILQRAPTEFGGLHRGLVEEAIAGIEHFLCERYDTVPDSNARWRQLAGEVPSFLGRFLSLYRNQQVPATPDAYEGLTDRNLNDMQCDPALPLLNLHWLFLAVAVLLKGASAHLWFVVPPNRPEGEYGHLLVTVRGTTLRVFVVGDSGTSLAKLMHRGFTDRTAAGGVVVIYAHEREPKKRASTPRRSWPGIPAPENPPEIWFRDMVDVGQTETELLKTLEVELLRASLC